MALLKNEQRMHWYVMRDLKRPNAKLPAYKQHDIIIELRMMYYDY